MYIPRILLAALTGIATLSSFTLAVPAVEVAERQVIIENYCCSIGCTSCTGIECPDDGCNVTYSCCAIIVSRKRDENGYMETFNERGEMVHFMSPVEK